MSSYFCTVYSSYYAEDIYTGFELYPYQVDCFGNESSLLSCWSTQNRQCQATYEAGYLPFIAVWCQGELSGKLLGKVDAEELSGHVTPSLIKGEVGDCIRMF